MTKSLQKLTFAIVALFITTAAFAQTSVLYFEDFENGIPSDYTLYDLDGLTPHANATTDGQAWTGIAGLAISNSWYNPPGASDDWMVTGAITLPSSAQAALSLTWFEQSRSANYAEIYEVRVSTTTTEVDSFHTVIYTTAGASSDGAIVTADLTPYAGETIFIAYRYLANDAWNLFIDDIIIFDVSSESAIANNVPKVGYFKNEYGSIQATVTNFGASTVQNMEMNYSIDGGATITDTVDVSGNPAFLDEFVITSDVIPTLSEGGHEVSCWVTAINGVPVSTDTVSTVISIYGDADVVANPNPLLEVFTSSTCAPCLQGNINIETALLDQPVNVVKVNYQQNFPGTGDPYATDESVDRRGHYGINSIPGFTVGGGWNGVTNPNGGVAASLWTNAQNEDAIISLDVYFSLQPDDQTVEVNGVASSTASLIPGTSLMLAIQENETDDNVKTNGETEFVNVFKKFINGSDGIDLGPRDGGDDFIFAYTHVFEGAYRLPADGQPASRIDHATEHSVEDFADLRVDGWVEHTSTQQVLQSGLGTDVSSTETPNFEATNKFNLAPNITDAQTNITLTLDKQEVVDIAVFDMNGQLVSQLENKRTLPAGTYNYTWSSETTGQFVVRLQTKDSFIGREVMVIK